MSKFSVDIRRIEKVWDHTNADRLSLAKVEGLAYQFVTQKDLIEFGRLIFKQRDPIYLAKHGF